MDVDALAGLRQGLNLTGDLARDVPAYLLAHGCPHTARHSAAVVSAARRLAEEAGVSPRDAETAAWLHDVSAVMPSHERVGLARRLSLPVLPEEAAYPPILHQKLSAVLADALFGVREVSVLEAIACHTTLKQNSTALDRVLFVADKIAWDQPGEPPYRAVLHAGLERSLEAAALAYLQYLWDRRDTLGVVHPWMAAAYAELRAHA